MRSAKVGPPGKRAELRRARPRTCRARHSDDTNDSQRGSAQTRAQRSASSRSLIREQELHTTIIAQAA
jgi:hypothetical protein